MARSKPVDDTDRASYRATEQLYVDHLIDEGQTFQPDERHVPGNGWEPLNEAAELAIMARDDAAKAALPTLDDKIEEARLAHQALVDQRPV